MKSALAFLAVVLVPLAAFADTFGTGTEHEFTIDFVNVTKGSVADDTGYGAVDNDYRIAKFEVSRGIISAYNAVGAGPLVAMSDMSSLGGNGVDRPATGVSWNEAARFVSWLNTSNGFPPAYKFSGGGANSDAALWVFGELGFDPENPFRHRFARYFLPSEDEWYRAAYFNPSSELYWDYATGSNTAPSSVSDGTSPGAAVYGHSTSHGPADVMNAGGLSPFGTMAQGGNVYEIVESAYSPPNDAPEKRRLRRGGVWNGSALGMSSASVSRLASLTTDEGNSAGFRVASLEVILPDSDGDGIADIFETNTGHFESISSTGTDPQDSDSDDDGLPDGIEVYVHGTDPNLQDTDQDGFTDSFELSTGFDPTSAENAPDALSTIRTAVEFRFAAAIGESYRIEATTDLENWVVIEDGIAGEGGGVTRFYSTDLPFRGFRARSD